MHSVAELRLAAEQARTMAAQERDSQLKEGFSKLASELDAEAEALERLTNRRKN